MIKNLFYKSFDVENSKIKIGRNISGLEAKVNVDDAGAYIIVVLKDGDKEIGQGYFNTLPSNRETKEVRASFDKLVHYIENDKYEIERSGEGSLFIDFPRFGDDFTSNKLYRVAIKEHTGIRG